MNRKPCTICGSELHQEQNCPFRPGDALEEPYELPEAA